MERNIVFHDVHLPYEHKPSWAAAKLFHSIYKPHRTHLLGDFADLPQASRFPKDDFQTSTVAEDAAYTAGEILELAQNTGEVIYTEGNHEERLYKALIGANDLKREFRGSTISWETELLAAGLAELGDKFKYVRQSVDFQGTMVGNVILRHGHLTKGGGMHKAANIARHGHYMSQMVGHHHSFEMRSFNSVRQMLAGEPPCVVLVGGYLGDPRRMPYTMEPDWQHAFTIIEVFDGIATLHPILLHNGRFCWNGRVYDGNVIAPAEIAKDHSKVRDNHVTQPRGPGGRFGSRP